MKKGFTLIELIITIGLIAAVGTIVVANMSSTLSREQDTQYQMFVKKLENAACTYVELKVFQETYGVNQKETCKNSSCTIKVKDLLDSGLIEEKDLKDPKIQDYISSNTSIRISYPGQVKTCTYQG